MATKKEINWEFWNKQKKIRLFEGVFLQKNWFVPDDQKDLTEEELHSLLFAVDEMAKHDNEYHQLINSMERNLENADKWRKLPREKAALEFISKKEFLELWNQCKLPQNQMFKSQISNEINRKEKDTLLRLFIGMVYVKYSAEKIKDGTINAKKISDDIYEKTAIELDDDTVRKYLRAGMELLPKNHDSLV